MSDQENRLRPLAFPELGPDTVLNLVEAGFEIPCTNLCRQLNSYINRVFELEAVDGRGLVVKFYRPGRWSKTALQDEHDFLLELNQQEIPVIPPMAMTTGGTLCEHGGGISVSFPAAVDGVPMNSVRINGWRSGDSWGAVML